MNCRMHSTILEIPYIKFEHSFVKFEMVFAILETPYIKFARPFVKFEMAFVILETPCIKFERSFVKFEMVCGMLEIPYIKFGRSFVKFEMACCSTFAMSNAYLWIFNPTCCSTFVAMSNAYPRIFIQFEQAIYPGFVSALTARRVIGKVNLFAKTLSCLYFRSHHGYPIANRSTNQCPARSKTKRSAGIAPTHPRHFAGMSIMVRRG